MIVILLILITSSTIQRQKISSTLKNLNNILFLFIYRRDSISNLILNTLWHLEISNNISKCSNYPEFNMTQNLLLDIIKEDIINVKNFQQEILDNINEVILEYKLFGKNGEMYLTSYYQYDSNNNIFLNNMSFDLAYDQLISNWDKYVEYDNFILNESSNCNNNNENNINCNKIRLLELFNSKYYLNTSNFNLTRFEIRLLKIQMNL